MQFFTEKIFFLKYFLTKLRHLLKFPGFALTFPFPPFAINLLKNMYMILLKKISPKSMQFLPKNIIFKNFLIIFSII